MKTHFIELMTMDAQYQKPTERFINLDSIVSVAEHPSKENYSIVICRDDVCFSTLGTPREILNDIYDRMPRDSMTLTYLLKERN